MKRLQFLLPALAIIAAIAVPLAAAQSTQKGVSSYTRRVLERAQDAIDEIGRKAGGASTVTDQSWFPYTTSKVSETLDAKMIRTLEGQNFVHATSCELADASLILAEMDKVRGLIKDANDQHKDAASQLLNDLYVFLSDRLGILSWSGTNPGYSDPSWTTPHAFDSSDEQQKISTETLCPFNTKYLPIAQDGESGCTPDAIDEAMSNLPDDAQTMKTAFEGERDAMAKLLDSWQTLHEANPTTKQWEGCQQVQQPYTWSSGYFWEFPGAQFTTFMNLSWNTELVRPLPSSSSSSSSFSSSSSLISVPVGNDVLQEYWNQKTQEFSQAQAKGDLTARAGILHLKEITDSFSPLTKTIADLSHLAHDKDQPTRSLRDMVQDFAYFLRRSCMNRPCNARLDDILNTAPVDACFPYTSGSGDIPANATEQQIKDLADTLTQACEQGKSAVK